MSPYNSTFTHVHLVPLGSLCLTQSPSDSHSLIQLQIDRLSLNHIHLHLLGLTYVHSVSVKLTPQTHIIVQPVSNHFIWLYLELFNQTFPAGKQENCLSMQLGNGVTFKGR